MTRSHAQPTLALLTLPTKSSEANSCWHPSSVVLAIRAFFFVQIRLIFVS